MTGDQDKLSDLQATVHKLNEEIEHLKGEITDETVNKLHQEID